MKDTFTIDGKEFKPSKMTISHNDIRSQNSGRTKSGYFVGDLVVYKWRIDAVFEPCSREQTQNLLNAIQKQYIKIGFTNPKTNRHDTFDSYAGAVTINVYNYDVSSNITYSGLNFSVVER